MIREIVHRADDRVESDQMIELQHKHAADCSSERDNSDTWQANKEFGKGGWGGVKADWEKTGT